MELSLQPNEVELLKRILENYLPQLREEIYKTENMDWRTSMHKDEALLKGLIARLEQMSPAKRP
jgi:chromosome condensin MukBEF complex kleisin-like MukF subunit